MAELYFVANGPMPTTAAQAAVTTGTVIKTMMVLKLGGSHTLRGKVVEWGISFDGSTAATPIKCELLTTDCAATVTAYAATAFINLDPLAATPTDDFPFDITSTTASGYTSTDEDAASSITVVREFDVQFVAPTNQYVKQWPLGREPQFKPAEYLRIRVTAGTAVNCYCYMVVEV